MPSPGRGAGMRRREFLGLAAGATAAWPLVARAQQPAMPVIGFLGLGTLDEARRVFAFISRGLVEAGYVEGRNLSVQFRFADYHADRLPALANELAQAQVAAIITGSGPALSATRAATASIPVVFFTGFDPVASGFVTSLNRPGGNVTGIFTLNPPLLIKRIELLHELIPVARSIAFLFTPTGNVSADEAVVRDMKAAANTFGVRLLFQKASAPGEFEDTFDALVRERIDAVMISADAVFTNNRGQLVALAARYRIPAIYPIREFSEAGGLLSYGTNYPDAYRQVGLYAGRVLKGDKPADLPVQQVTKFELVINLKTAKALGISVPPTLLARADVVIE
jgi:putative tryptophan/tyrosine transport system substrate-binding protein